MTQTSLYILTTDALIFFLVACVIIFAVYARRHEHLRAPWRQIVRRPIAMSAFIVLSVYIILGLMDSIHLKEVTESEDRTYQEEIVSVLDKLLGPVRNQVEKTYSAPFAIHAATLETVETPEGYRRIAPRLEYGGAHIEKLEYRNGDILKRLALSVLEGVSVILLLLAGLLAWLAKRKEQTFRFMTRAMLKGELSLPWRAIGATLTVITILVFCIINLATHYHVLGTDQVGNDVFYKSIKSIRTGLLIGTLTTLIMLPFAIALGIMAGYFRGWVDDIIQYLYTTLSSIPGILLIAAAILSLQVYMANHPQAFETLIERSDMRLLFLCIILGITSWTGLCRLLRGETLKVREIDYVQAAVALGVSRYKIMARHIFPNLMHIVLISIVLDFSGLVLAEAVLSYVGVGVDPSMDSWGNMINGARLEMAREPVVWWSLASAFIFMFGLVLSANLFSDAVRDAFDPRLRRR